MSLQRWVTGQHFIDGKRLFFGYFTFQNSLLYWYINNKGPVLHVTWYMLVIQHVD